MYLTKKFLSFLTLTILSALWAASTEASPTTVFVLGSGKSASPWTKDVNQGITKTLKQTNLPFIYYIDYLDAGRFDEVKQQDAVFNYLKTKFGQRTPDIFISAGPAASSFSLRYPDLFPSSKRILIQPRIDDTVQVGNAVVIDTEIDYSLMISEALRLSEPEQVFIVGDSIKPSDLHRLNNISNELEQAHISYQSLENKDLSTLLKEVSDIPSNSAVFFTPIYREHKGRGLPPVFVLKKLNEVASAPIFSTSVSELGFGSVGGYLHSPTELGMMAGEATINIINNEQIEYLHDGFELAYDWNEIERWGYQHKVSTNADMRFKQLSLWEEHQKEAIVITVFVIILTILLITLIIYNRKLNKVKNALSKERKLLEKKVDERTKELTVLHQEAEKMARVDELTGISNRRAFFELGGLTHSQTKRTNNPYTIIMIDIDWFKAINDTYGHAVGDCVIKNIANILTSVARKSDVVARIGGEEFAVILTNTPCDKVPLIAERIRVAAEQNTIQVNQQTVNATVSIGVAEYQPQDTGIDSVLARADKALYQAKESGKNTVTF